MRRVAECMHAAEMNGLPPMHGWHRVLMLIELIGLMEGSQKAKMLGSLLRVICVLSSFGLVFFFFSEKCAAVNRHFSGAISANYSYRCWSGSIAQS